jgi:hypothetical protein
VNEPTIDPEQLAALLDGRLTAEQRSALLAQLALSDADFEIFVTALLAQRDAESTIPSPAAPRLRASRRSPATRWLAVAAVFFVVFAIPTIWWRLARPTTLLAPTTTLPLSWDGHPWSTTRGAGDPLTPDARAARIAARLVDLDVAVNTHDSTASTIAADIAALLDPIPATGPLIALYHQLAQAPTKSVATPLLAQARPATLRLLSPAPAAAATWLESARLATAHHDAPFFHTPQSTATLSHLTPIADPTIVQHLQSTIAASGDIDWTALDHDLTTLLSALGS